MPPIPVFTCHCSYCRRLNEKPLSLLAQLTHCDHCGTEFMARDGDSQSAAENDPIYFWIRFTAAATCDTEPLSGVEEPGIKPR